MMKRRKPGKIYPNDPCPCDSGAKYKVCYMETQDDTPPRSPAPAINRGNGSSSHREYFNLKGKNAEQFVHVLAEKTFLADWCYLNPMRAPGIGESAVKTRVVGTEGLHGGAEVGLLAHPYRHC